MVLCTLAVVAMFNRERTARKSRLNLGGGAPIPLPPPFLTVPSFSALPPFLSSLIPAFFTLKSIKYYIHLNIKSEHPSFYPILK